MTSKNISFFLPHLLELVSKGTIFFAADNCFPTRPETLDEKTYSVIYQTGPVLISDVYYEHPEMVNVSPKEQWNPIYWELPSTPVFTCQYSANVWLNSTG